MWTNFREHVFVDMLEDSVIVSKLSSSTNSLKNNRVFYNIL